MICTGSAVAQNGVQIPGWYPLPDSLFQIWELEHDQVRRLRVIEEDHNTERAEILNMQGLGTTDRDKRLQQLASERRREIKAVLQVKQYEDWERRSKLAGGR
jgi:hypothetical protein